MRTKRHIPILLLLFAVNAVWAGNVTPSEARQKAIAFIQAHRPALHRAPLMAARPAVGEALQPFYVYNIGQREGFVIISGDDRTPDVLGYADEGAYQEQDLPENMRQWLAYYADQIALLRLADSGEDGAPAYDTPPYANGGEEPGRSRVGAPEAVNRVQRPAIAPLLRSKWGQGEPFNCQLPLDPTTNKGVQTGCIATSMAQVMHYYRYPDATLAPIPAYTTSTRGISMPEIGQTTIDWDNMLAAYDSDATTLQTNAVGTLMRLCGQAVLMDYRSSSSSSSSGRISAALMAYFGYDAGIRFITRSHYDAEQWDELLYNELSHRRPIIYRGTRDRNGTDSSHSFIIDGCDDSGLYHVNWGWSGSYNGYFLLSVLSPYENSESGMLYDNEGYTISQQAVVGIQPEAGGEPEPPLLTSQGISIGGSTTFSRTAENRNFTNIRLVSRFFNFTGATHVFDQGIGALDEDGQLVGCQATATNRRLDNNYGSAAFESVYAFGADLPDGKYRIINISREHQDGEPWQPNINSEQCFVWAVISNNTLTLEPVSVELSGSIEAEGRREAGSLVKLHVGLHNDGTDFNEMVYLMVNGERKGGRLVNLEAGGNAEVEMGFVPDQPGSYRLQLAVEAGDDYEYFAEAQVDVVSAASNALVLSLVSTNAGPGKTVGSTLRLTVKAFNDGATPYDNRLRGLIYKLRTDGSNTGDLAARQDHDVLIEAGATATSDFVFSDLEPGRYFLYFYYISLGDVDRDHRLYSGTYTVERTATDISPAAGDQWLATGDRCTTVYSLEGRRMGACQEKQLPALLQELPKAVYVVDGKIVAN